MITFCVGAIFGAMSASWLTSMPGGSVSLNVHLVMIAGLWIITLMFISLSVGSGDLAHALRIAQNFSGYTVGSAMVWYHVFFAKKS